MAENKTILSAELGGVEVTGIEELTSTEIQATFDQGNSEAKLTTQSINFKGEAHQKLMELFAFNPLEAPDFVPKIQKGSLLVDKKYSVDFSSLVIKSPVQSEASINYDEGSPSFERQAKVLTLQLLKQKGVIGPSDAVQIPYIVENRKRLIEFILLQIQLVTVSKSIYDEVHKLINIVSDIISGSAIITAGATVVALIDLSVVVTNLVLLTIELVYLIIQTKNLLFPPIRYHLGINMLNYLQKGCNYLGKTVDVGPVLEWYLTRDNLMGSKNDEVGPSLSPLSIDPAVKLDIDAGDGLLNPRDFGYTLGQLIDLIKIKYHCKGAVIGNTYHLKPWNDPFWTTSPALEIPDVLIEDALGYQNGFQQYNYDELVIRSLIEYQKDTSDYHTLTDTNNRMCEVIYDSTISNNQRNLLKGVDDVQIPYALCVRKPSADNLFTKFLKVQEVFNTFETTLKEWYDKYPALEEVPLPNIIKTPKAFLIKEGALRMENHFCDVPKMVWLDPDTGRIPENFLDFVSADNLWRNFHSFKCMAPGWKDPSNPSRTNQKYVFRGVKIPFNIDDFQLTIENNSLNSPTYGQGEFLNLSWNPNNDFAICDFYIYKNWIPEGKLTAELYEMGPTATEG